MRIGIVYRPLGKTNGEGSAQYEGKAREVHELEMDAERLTPSIRQSGIDLLVGFGIRKVSQARKCGLVGMSLDVLLPVSTGERRIPHDRRIIQPVRMRRVIGQSLRH